MKLLFAAVVGVILGGVGTIAIERHRDREPAPLAAPTPALSDRPFQLSRTKIVCDREHIAFDAAGYAYCQEIPKNAIVGRYLNPADAPKAPQ